MLLLHTCNLLLLHCNLLLLHCYHHLRQSRLAITYPSSETYSESSYHNCQWSLSFLHFIVSILHFYCLILPFLFIILHIITWPVNAEYFSKISVSSWTWRFDGPDLQAGSSLSEISSVIKPKFSKTTLNQTRLDQEGSWTYEPQFWSITQQTGSTGCIRRSFWR